MEVYQLMIFIIFFLWPLALMILLFFRLLCVAAILVGLLLYSALRATQRWLQE